MKKEDYESQFAPGCGTPEVRREIDRINRIVARMLRAGIPKRDVDFLVKVYEGQGINTGRRLELERIMEDGLKAKQASVN